VQARLEDAAQCLLVVIGATPEGKKELVGLIDGVRESAQSWKELLLDLKRRGLAIGPELAVAGIRADHPHFAEFGNVLAQWDCTRRGEPVSLEPGSSAFNELDGDGHGTHVAGIIGGHFKLRDGTDMAGMAPRCGLYGFKVLDDQGDGQDSWIIKAIDLVARITRRLDPW
jgi:hypothetical protein